MPAQLFIALFICTDNGANKACEARLDLKPAKKSYDSPQRISNEFSMMRTTVCD
jgi:hypothetical protein